MPTPSLYTPIPDTPGFALRIEGDTVAVYWIGESGIISQAPVIRFVPSGANFSVSRGPWPEGPFNLMDGRVHMTD